MRLDKWLTTNVEIESISKAKALILAGNVLVNEKPIHQSGFKVSPKDNIRIRKYNIYYSRSALKLKAALKKWPFKVENKNFIDIGAAHGGFTQVLLENKACSVFTLDVSYGQLHPVLRRDPRVFVKERKSLYKITKEDIPFQPDAFVIDISFSSLKRALAYMQKMWKNMEGIALLKPQFESDSFMLEKGIVKDNIYLKAILDDFLSYLKNHHIQLIGLLESPILGAKGNQEYLLWLEW